MTDNLHITSIELPDLFHADITEILQRVLTPVHTSGEDDIVGIQIYLTFGGDRLVEMSPLGELVLNRGDKFWTRSWSFLTKDHPKRSDIAVAFAELSELIGRVNLNDALDQMTNTDEKEHFILSLFADGASLNRSDAMENVIEPLSWEDETLEQSTINSCFALVTPNIQSSHERLAALPVYENIQKVILDLTHVSWNETDPVIFDFCFSPDND